MHEGKDMYIYIYIYIYIYTHTRIYTHMYDKMSDGRRAMKG